MCYDKVITERARGGGPGDQEPRRRCGCPEPRDDGHGFGVVAADVNNDGLIDIFVANDMNPNFLFLNRGDGTFDDVSEISGAAYNMNGKAQSGMGVDAEDVDGDGLPELFVTNFANEYSTLYQNFGKGIFYDNTAFFGLASDSMPWVKWGCALADFDNDGWPDCFFVNGHVDNNRRAARPAGRLRRDPAPVPQRPGQAVPAGDPGRRARTSTPSTSAGARPSATSTTTATSISWSTTRTARRPCSATTPSRTTTGSGSSSRGPRATATPSAPSSRSRPATGRSTASARGATACRRPTILACWSGSGPPPRSRRS